VGRRGPRLTLVSQTTGEGARYAALDPPTALTRGEEKPTLVPVGAFVERLRGV
jgi:hypothetical protein